MKLNLAIVLKKTGGFCSVFGYGTEQIQLKNKTNV